MRYTNGKEEADMPEEINRINAEKQALLTDDKEKEHEFIQRAEEERTTAKYIYYLWLSRLFIFFATISLIVFLSSSLSLFKLSQEVTVEPFLIINQNSSDGIVRDEPIATDMASKNQLMEMFIKQYVILRNTIIRDW